MAYIQMKCPNCGGTVRTDGNHYTCPSCRTIVLNIIDAKIDSDVTVMTPDEFERKIEASKRQFIVNINGDLKVFDVDTMVINKQIQDATACLARSEFDKVIAILSHVPRDILSAERLRFLAEMRVMNEYELSFHDGYIDENPHFQNIIRLADDQTRTTYQKIAAYCREQYDTKRHIEAEISEVDKLLRVELYQEAIAYTKEMCKKYPQTALSWAYACEVKCTISGNYNGNFEFSMMEKCPDYSEAKLPEKLRKKINHFSNLSTNYTSEYNQYVISLGTSTFCMWVAVVPLILHTFIRSSTRVVQILLSVATYAVAPLFLILSVMAMVLCIKCAIKVPPLRKEYYATVNLVPEKIKKQYGANFSPRDRIVFVFAATVLWVLAAAIIIYIFATKVL